MSKLKIYILLLIGFSNLCISQINTPITELKNIQLRQTKITKISAISLNSWAIANIGFSSVALTKTTQEAKYFHQMNVVWNLVNLGIGIPSLVSSLKKQEDLNFEGVIKKQNKLETIYLLNTGIDLAYMTAGLAIRFYGNNQIGENSYRLKGFGSSIIFQGSFLFVYDLATYLFLKTNTKMINKEWGKLSFTGNGVLLELK